MRYHWWQLVGSRNEKIRCQFCEEIVTFSGKAAAMNWIEYDDSKSCKGIPGPVRPLDSEYITKEY